MHVVGSMEYPGSTLGYCLRPQPLPIGRRRGFCQISFTEEGVDRHRSGSKIGAARPVGPRKTAVSRIFVAGTPALCSFRLSHGDESSQVPASGLARRQRWTSVTIPRLVLMRQSWASASSLARRGAATWIFSDARSIVALTEKVRIRRPRLSRFYKISNADIRGYPAETGAMTIAPKWAGPDFHEVRPLPDAIAERTLRRRCGDAGANIDPRPISGQR